IQGAARQSWPHGPGWRGWISGRSAADRKRALPCLSLRCELPRIGRQGLDARKNHRGIGSEGEDEARDTVNGRFPSLKRKRRRFILSLKLQARKYYLESSAQLGT